MSSSKKHGSLMGLKPKLPQLKMTKPLEEVERMLLSESESTSGPGGASGRFGPSQAPGERTTDQPTVNTNVKPFIQTNVPTTDQAYDGSDEQASAASTVSDRNVSFPGEGFIDRIKRAKGPVAFVGFKIPADLKEELEKVARFNGTDMTKIVVEGLRLILPHLPHPPE